MKQVKWIEEQVHLRGGQTTNLECGNVMLWKLVIVTIQFVFLLDHEVMVSSALRLLSGSVHIIGDKDKVVRLATTALPVSLHQHLKPISMPQVYMCKLEKSEFKELSDVAFVHLHLAHYRNQLLHLFIEDAMLTLCLDLDSDYGKSTAVV